MKLPGIFELTKREQRAVILIVMALLAGAIARHYRAEHVTLIPARSTSVEPGITPSPTPPGRPAHEPDE
jgi:hypothetical protein